MWLIIALAGYFFGALVNVLDKIILDKTVSKVTEYVFYSTAPAFFILILFFWTGGLVLPFHYLVALLAGGMFTLGLWANFKGMQQTEISHIGPFIGAMTALFIVPLSILFFQEFFSTKQLIALLFLIFGSLVIAVEETKTSRGFGKGTKWAILGSFLMAIFAVLSKYLYNSNNFLNSFIFIQGSVGLTGLSFLFFKDLRQKFFKKAEKPKNKTKQNYKKVTFITITKIIGILSLILVQYAVALKSAALVYALAGIQYVLLIFFVFALTKLLPKFYNEEYSKTELIQEVIAVISIGIGLFFLI